MPPVFNSTSAAVSVSAADLVASALLEIGVTAAGEFRRDDRQNPLGAAGIPQALRGEEYPQLGFSPSALQRLCMTMWPKIE